MDSSLTALYGILGTFLSPIFFEYCKNRLGKVEVNLVNVSYDLWRSRNFQFKNHDAPKSFINWLDRKNGLIKYGMEQYTMKKN